MKRTFLPLLLTLVFVMLTGCGGETTDGIKIPSSAGVYKGENYQEVIAGLEEAGFTNIETEVLDDLVTGILTKDGEVESVSVNGETKYDPDARYAVDVKIVVVYHTFPQTNESEQSDEPTTSSETNVDKPTQSETITIKNNEEFVAVLSTTDESIITDFVDKYKGQIIEFDGNIAGVTVHSVYNAATGTSKDAKGYYDILMYAGDYDENTAIGPNFQFENASAYSLGFESNPSLPEFIKIGANVHITAMVGIYNENTCIWSLIPKSIEQR